MPDLAGTVFSLVLSDYNGSPYTRFFRGTTRLMSWPDGERYLRPQQSFVVSIISRIPSSLFSDWRCLCHRNSLTHRFPRFPPRNLCSLVTLAVFSRPHCNGHSLLLSFYLSRIGRIENSSCSACRHPSQGTSHLILHCPTTDYLRRSLLGDSLSLNDLWSRPWEVAWLLGPMVFHDAPIPRKGSDSQQQQE